MKTKIILFLLLFFVFCSVFPQHIAILLGGSTVFGQVHQTDENFPVKAEVIVDEPFQACEGIAFNGQGDLFVTANRSLWQVMPDGSVNKITELFTNLGIAAFSDRDILVADFGPTNAFRNGKNNDGMVWLVTPEGEKKKVVARFIG